MPSKQLNRLLWLGMLAVLAFLAVTFDVAPFLGSGRLTVVHDPADERIILRWRGSIEAPMQAKLTEAFQEHRHRIRPQTVDHRQSRRSHRRDH